MKHITPLELLHRAFIFILVDTLFFLQGASERTLPHSLQPDVQQQVDSIYVKRLASLSESGVLPGADDWDIVNPMVVRAASEVRAHVSSPGTQHALPPFYLIFLFWGIFRY
jgi:hypothetical protein